MKCSKCGHDRFYAHQKAHLLVIVDEDGNFYDNVGSRAEVVETENPYGPFECTRCGQEYNVESLKEGRCGRSA